MSIYSIINSNYDIQNQELSNNELSTILNKNVNNKLIIKDISDIQKNLIKGDMIICSELSMLSLNVSTLISFLEFIQKNNIKVYCDKEFMILGNNTETRMLLISLEIAYKLHKKNISIKTKQSLKLVKTSGKQLGRPIGFTHRKLEKHKKKILELLDNNMSKRQLAKKFNCSYITMHRFIKDCLNARQEKSN